MKRRRLPRNDFGKAIALFCLEHDIPKKELAKMCNVNYRTLIDASTDRTPGYEIVPKVEEFMRTFKAN